MQSKPNVVLIVADDCGYGDLGCFGDGTARTPALDALVADGVVFRQHYSASPICAPARASLLTGRYPHRTGAIAQHEVHGLDRIGLGEVTLADRFKAAGYATGLIGKWHNGTFDPRFEPNARGFNEFVGFCGGWSDYYRWHLRENDSLRKGDGRYMTDVLTEEAQRFVQRHRKDAFFLMLAYSAPHSPFQAPESLVRPYRDRGLSRIVGTTYAMIERMDEGIGELMETLRRTGVEQNTIVLFTSDNGPAFFNPSYMLEPGEPTFNERFNAGMRGSKGWVYEGGIRVPMIVRWPGGMPGGRISDRLIHFTDWVPTLTALAGIARTSGPPLDGCDVSPLLRGGELSEAPRRFWQWNLYAPYVGTNAAARDGDWKLVRPMITGTRFFTKEMFVSEADEQLFTSFVQADLNHKTDPRSVTRLIPVPHVRYPPPEPVELYNLRNDPNETVDLAAHCPERASRMLRDLETWFEEVEAERRRFAETGVAI
jgi:arylsulfatase A